METETIKLSGSELIQVVCEALGLNPDVVQSISIKAEAGYDAVVEIEQFADARLFDVDWRKALGQDEGGE